jgi:hypothetical protein
MPYGNLLADVVQGSTANTPPVFKDGNGTTIGTLCRAWVNFNGTGTVAIRASFNVSSITDNGTGDYTLNFINALPDANYSFFGGVGRATARDRAIDFYSLSTTSVRVEIFNPPDSGARDVDFISVSVFR